MYMIPTLILSLLLVAALGGIAIVYKRLGQISHQVREQRSMVRQELATNELRLYRQFESLLALRDELGVQIPLPPLREWAGSPDFLLELFREIKIRKPATIVECSSGASTLVAARACQLNGAGHVYSLENASEFAMRTRRMIENAGLQSWATVIDAPLKRYTLQDRHYDWYSIDQLRIDTIDMLVVDGPLGRLNEQARYPAAPLLFSRLSERAIVLVDDADRPDERAIVERWSHEFAGFRREERTAEKGLAVLVRAPDH
jgi:predicted O-methyltransferase YrrM